MLRYYMTPQTREMLIAESKRLVEERARKRREGESQRAGGDAKMRAADRPSS